MILIPLVAAGGAYYYARSQSSQSTDDAFIDGHIINVAPQVAGRVDRVLVNDNQLVKKGDLVVVLDNRNFVATSDQKVAAQRSTVLFDQCADRKACKYDHEHNGGRGG